MPTAVKFQARFISNLVSELPCLSSFYVCDSHFSCTVELSLIGEEQDEGGEKGGVKLLLLVLLNSVPWNQMVVDLFNSTLKADSKEK